MGHAPPGKRTRCTSGTVPLTSLAVDSLDLAGTVVTVSSGGMYSERLEPSRMQMTATDYDGVKAYAKAKRVQVVLNQVWAERHPAGPTFAAMHPGWADTTGVRTPCPDSDGSPRRSCAPPRKEPTPWCGWLRPTSRRGSSGLTVDPGPPFASRGLPTPARMRRPRSTSWQARWTRQWPERCRPLGDAPPTIEP